MATSGDTEIKPDHVIIWGDKNMAVHENYQSNRAVLNINANLERPPSNEYSPEIDNFICNMDLELNNENYDDLIKSPLRMFTQETECIKCIHDNNEAKKKIFLITSGRMGRLIIPQVHKILHDSIYIFCGTRDEHEEWTKDYENDIEIYDDEKGVFAKVLSDIAIYYLLKGQNETSNKTHAIQYLHWAQRLFMSASRIDNIDRKDFLKCVHDELDERQVSSSDGNNSDDE